MNIPIITADGKLHIMTSECYARWLCLIEALEVITEDAEKNNIDLEANDKWIKPLALQKYIDERFHAMHYDVRYDHEQRYNGD